MSKRGNCRLTKYNKNSYLLFICLLLLPQSSVLHVLAEESSKPVDKPHSLFGQTKRETNRAMKSITKALRVECTYCHLRTGRKVDYRAETLNKATTRAMKRAFVDGLSEGGDTLVAYARQGRTVRISASYNERDGRREILLHKIEDGQSTDEMRIDVSGNDSGVKCATCHSGKVHLFKPD